MRSSVGRNMRTHGAQFVEQGEGGAANRRANHLHSFGARAAGSSRRRSEALRYGCWRCTFGPFFDGKNHAVVPEPAVLIPGSVALIHFDSTG